jgi:asparagine synthase (glutamine-hydrolysing)
LSPPSGHRQTGRSLAAAVDLPRLRKLLEAWPEGGWHTSAVASEYRLALLRGVANGHFLRKASRSNA